MDNQDNPDNIVPLPNIKEIEAQAATWVMCFDEGEMTAEEERVFKGWYRETEAHRTAFDRLASLWGKLDIVKELHDIVSEAGDTARAMPPASRLKARRGWLMSVAASIAVIACIGLFVFSEALFGTYSHSFDTAIGQRQTISLPDGSQIELNTNGRVEVSFTRNARDVRLVRGEAFFDVAHDKRRPFSVHAGKGAVTAVGTAFMVRLQDAKVNVTVTEGRVALYAKPATAPEAAESITTPEPLSVIVAGQNAIFDDEIEQIQSMESQAIARKLSWRDGILSFSGTPLSDVVADVSRYTDIAIEIEDEDLAQLPVAGYFEIGDVQTMFDALEIMAGLQAVWVGQKHVRLTRAQ